jgi:hypothetical protein
MAARIEGRLLKPLLAVALSGGHETIYRRIWRDLRKALG